MLSTKLVHLIERNWEEIATRLIASIRANAETPYLAARPDIELREWCRDILENLGSLLVSTRTQDIKQRFEAIGRRRFEESIPLHEAVLRFQLLHEKIVGFIHEQGFAMTALHLYAEEELEMRICTFFDAMVYGLVRGYEEAMRNATSRAAG